jgi:hypothetical protein
MTLGHINIMLKEEEIYMDAGTTLQKGIQEFLIQEKEEAHSVKNIRNQNRKWNIANGKMDIVNKR